MEKGFPKVIKYVEKRSCNSNFATDSKTLCELRSTSSAGSPLGTYLPLSHSDLIKNSWSFVDNDETKSSYQLFYKILKNEDTHELAFAENICRRQHPKARVMKVLSQEEVDFAQNLVQKARVTLNKNIIIVTLNAYNGQLKASNRGDYQWLSSGHAVNPKLIAPGEGMTDNERCLGIVSEENQSVSSQRVIDFKCGKQNIGCEIRVNCCSNGITKNYETCVNTGIEDCQSCHENYRLVENPKNPNTKVCRECDPGYHLTDDTCVENVCTCPLGASTTGKDCPNHGDPYCSSCSDGSIPDPENGECYTTEYCIKNMFDKVLYNPDFTSVELDKKNSKITINFLVDKIDDYQGKQVFFPVEGIENFRVTFLESASNAWLGWTAYGYWPSNIPSKVWTDEATWDATVAISSASKKMYFPNMYVSGTALNHLPGSRLGNLSSKWQMLPTSGCEILKCFFRFPIFAPPVRKILKTSKNFAPMAQKPSQFKRFSRLRHENLKCFFIFLRLRRKMLLLWNSSFHSYQVCRDLTKLSHQWQHGPKMTFSLPQNRALSSRTSQKILVEVTKMYNTI